MYVCEPSSGISLKELICEQAKSKNKKRIFEIERGREEETNKEKLETTLKAKINAASFENAKRSCLLCDESLLIARYGSCTQG